MPCSRQKVLMLTGGTPVEEGEADLVRNNLDAVLHQHAKMRGVEIGDAEMPDQPFLLQPHQLGHGVEIAGMLVVPPVELQEIETIDTEAI